MLVQDNIGNYENCSFNSKGIGTYMGNEHSNPEFGERFEFVEGDEIKIEVTFEKHLENKILKALFKNHAYEEVAYEIYELQNTTSKYWIGNDWRIMNIPMEEKEFLRFC